MKIAAGLVALFVAVILLGGAFLDWKTSLKLPVLSRVDLLLSPEQRQSLYSVVTIFQ
jgi:hypothetical protein